ncbi:unnamed protein product [Didymodactylos carnosus]|uniref:Endonuclease/exonuclease/phosphatase domain-containing protein n=1 Tax=Didymodactylos carnosus TaxID=1234261 RepID=A0A8S2DTI9_9BILA|nr:unnamed protein product [Didymodactylos carnosus]CAF3743620.1 unnamed protein product [Didymodactylos carnosus]
MNRTLNFNAAKKDRTITGKITSISSPSNVQLQHLYRGDFSIRVFVSNIRSLLSHMDSVCTYLSLNKSIVLCLAETRLDSTIVNNDLAVPHYHTPIRKDRNRRGGGCAVYVRSDYYVKRLVDFQNTTFEILVLRLTLPNKLSVIIINVYRPKSTSIKRLNERIKTVLDEIKKSKYKKDRIHLVGDFNAHHRLWSNNNVKSTKAGEIFYDFLEEENLYQLVRVVTRDVSGTCLDLIIVESSSFIIDIAVRPSVDRSDHNFTEFKIQILSLKEKTERTVYDYNAVNWEKVNERFSEIPIHQLLKNYNNLNERVTAFEQILLEHIQYYVPNKKICIEPRNKVWFNDKLRILYKKKWKLYRKCKNSSYHFQLYAKAAEEFKAACTITKEDYYKRINLKVCASSANW